MSKSVPKKILQPLSLSQQRLKPKKNCTNRKTLPSTSSDGAILLVLTALTLSGAYEDWSFSFQCLKC